VSAPIRHPDPGTQSPKKAFHGKLMPSWLVRLRYRQAVCFPLPFSLAINLFYWPSDIVDGDTEARDTGDPDSRLVARHDGKRQSGVDPCSETGPGDQTPTACSPAPEHKCTVTVWIYRSSACHRTTGRSEKSLSPDDCHVAKYMYSMSVMWGKSYPNPA
jgi:hypothetical protein